MNLEVEFGIIKEGQEKILQMISGVQSKASKENAIYSIGDLAKMFKVTPRTIYNWKEQGIISFTQIGSKTYMTSSQLERFLSQNEVKSLKVRRN